MRWAPPGVALTRGTSGPQERKQPEAVNAKTWPRALQPLYGHVGGGKCCALTIEAIKGRLIGALLTDRERAYKKTRVSKSPHNYRRLHDSLPDAAFDAGTGASLAHKDCLVKALGVSKEIVSKEVVRSAQVKSRALFIGGGGWRNNMEEGKVVGAGTRWGGRCGVAIWQVSPK